MDSKPVSSACNQTLIERLREETSAIHQDLHEHPLMVELLQRTSADAYRNVLHGFLMFYKLTEPRLVESAGRLGVAELYPAPVRTTWLMEDLQNSGQGHLSPDPTVHQSTPLPLTNISQLVGCLYVIKGSALGGRAILKELAGQSCVERANRFFTGDGEQTPRLWCEFQQFANESCRSAADQNAASLSARQTFLSIQECLTQSMQVNSISDSL